MNMHNATLIPINGNQPSESTLLGRDEHELIEAAINHYLQHFIRLQGELRTEELWWSRRKDKVRADDYFNAGYTLGTRLQKLRKLSDEVANATEVHFIPQED